MSKLRVAMFSPLPPAWTGTADYAASLASELEKFVDLRVYENVPRSFSARSFDTVVYQIANNPYHAAIYKAALRHPGVVVLHEPNLHDLVKGTTLNHGREEAYLAEVVYEIFSHELREVATDPSLYECPQPRTFTLLRRLLQNSTGCIVHSSYADQIVRAKQFEGPTTVIPHGATARHLDGEPYRRSLGLDSRIPIVGVFGYQRPDKRGIECLQVFAELRRFMPNSHMLVVGVPHPEVDLETLIRDLNLERHVSVVAFQKDLNDFDGHIAACDVVVNLRSPTLGETSGTLMRALGLGKTVITSDNGSNVELPEGICIRIPDDQHQGAVLLECLKWLLGESAAIHEIGRRAREWVGQHCTWPETARRYAEFLTSVAEGKSPETANEISRSASNAGFRSASDAKRYVERWVKPESEAAGYFETHSVRLARTLELTPCGSSTERILEMGCYLQITPALERVLGYGEVRGCYLGAAGGAHRRSVTARDGEQFQCRVDLFNAESDVFPYPDGYFAAVLCCELLEHLEHDPMHMLAEVYRVLRRGGTLVLTTPNIVSARATGAVLAGKHPASFSRYQRSKLRGASEPGHAREYTPDEIRLLCSDAGFLVRHIETGAYGDTSSEDERGVAEVFAKFNYSKAMRGDCIYVCASKEIMPRTRFPVWLYGS